MIYGVYTVRDVKTGFLPPTFDVNDDAAKRNFLFAFKNAKSIFTEFPEDYSLYKIGEFDTESGEIRGFLSEFLIDAPKNIERSE